MAEKVIDTGAAGFIGSHVVDALLARGDVVVGIDNFDTFYDPDLKRANLADVVAFNGENPAAAIDLVVNARNAARKSKDFALGDRLRNALTAEGIVLTDGKDGVTTWTATSAG